jgi:hypothetical protein
MPWESPWGHRAYSPRDREGSFDIQQRMDMMEMVELIEDRHGEQAAIIASQLLVTSWYEVIG